MTTDPATPTHNGNGTAAGAAMRAPDLDDLRAENARLLELLARAEEVAARYAILLREGDHRIKNSLQIVSSLMSMQAGVDENGSVALALRTAATRVRSVARIHDALQASGGEDSLDLGATLRTMCEALHAMAGDPRGVSVVVDAEPLQAPVAFAQPIILAVNELVVNALRHAFPDDHSGAVRVSVKKADGQVCVCVEDNGVGLPPNYAEGRGYGMKLVRMMAGQIDAYLQIDSTPGARFTLTAPTP